MTTSMTTELVPATSTAITDIIHFALDKGTSVDQLERLVALQERIMDRNAAAEFYDAMAQFQRKCPPIRKTSTASFATKSGGAARYTYAELDEIARTVNPILAALGISYTWDSTVTDGLLVCTCVLRHRNGHAVSAKFGSKVEGSSLMSGHQATAATLTYARRQSLVQALGLTTTDDDTDGHEPDMRIGADDVAEITALIEDLDDPSELGRVLKWAGVNVINEVPASKLATILNGLRSKLNKKRAVK